MTIDTVEIESAWRHELKKRINDIENGLAETLPFDEVLAEARQAIATIHQ